jgi:hypothetical protein
LATSSHAQCHCSFDEELERAYLRGLHWGSKGGYHNGFYEEKEWIKVTMPGFCRKRTMQENLIQRIEESLSTWLDCGKSSCFQRSFEAGKNAGFKQF